jgi:glycosyltransferase involved in cell wall biosynthesis
VLSSIYSLPAEAFGLMPLEAMAMGTTVVGFDGFGGRDYMRSEVNCAVTAYPDIERLADRIVALLSDPDYAEALAGAGRSTACAYSYDRLRAAWPELFSHFLGEAPRG